MEKFYDSDYKLPNPVSDGEIYHLDYQFDPPVRYGSIWLVQIGRMFCDKTTVVGNHTHLNWFELTIVTDGEGIISTNGVEIPIKGGDIYLSFPADTHGIKPSKDQPLKFDFFSFYTKNEKYLDSLEKIMQSFRSPGARLFSDAKIQELVGNAILEFGDNPLIHSKELLANLFETILIYLVRAFPLSPQSQAFASAGQAEILCFQLMNHIDTHIFSIKSLQELSELTNYNYSYLSALFRSTTGRTLLDYYQTSRLKAAKSILKENKLKIGEVAELLNYSSVYAFSKAYKNKYGKSPSSVRKK